jgi:hypothetical protein
VTRVVLIAAAALVLLAGGGALARMLGAGAGERDAVIDIVKAQSRGDARGVVADIERCGASAACVASTRAQVRRLRGRGKVRVLRIDGTSRLALSAGGSTARVAWKAGRGLPVVQCVRLRRTGDLLRGFDVRVVSLSAPIGREEGC